MKFLRPLRSIDFASLRGQAHTHTYTDIQTDIEKLPFISIDSLVPDIIRI